MVAFSRANKDGKYNKLIGDCEKFVKQQQWDGGEGKEPSDPFYGGAGYGSKARPDLSNTSFMIDALHELGRGGDDEAIQRALTFVTRCQNLEGPQNNTPAATKVNDGGFFYTTANGGESMAGTEPDGGLRSYGSMTYAGLKSMIYAGVSKDDPRVKAAVSFLQKNIRSTRIQAWDKPAILLSANYVQSIEGIWSRQFCGCNRQVSCVEKKSSANWRLCNNQTVAGSIRSALDGRRSQPSNRLRAFNSVELQEVTGSTSAIS